MKRFYKVVSTRKSSNGFEILLDNRPIKTKAGHILLAPEEPLAEALVREWSAQKDQIIPDTMPLTQILNTQLDRVSTEREAMTAAILKYLDTDLICYFAEEPEELISLQEQSWKRWLDWFEEVFGEALKTTNSLLALQQSERAHESVRDYVKNLDDAYFTVLQLVTSLSGSLILGLAFVQGKAKADDILAACYVEESYKEQIYNAEKYGMDPMLEKEKLSKRKDFEAAEVYFKSIC